MSHVANVLENPPLFTKEIKGTPVPALGFGTFELKGETCRKAVIEALETGYRHIDTARMYDNEAEVGQGIEDSEVPREDIFVTSKVWWEDLSPHGIREAVESNFDIFDFALDAEDKTAIEKLPKDKRQINPSFAPEWDDE